MRSADLLLVAKPLATIRSAVSAAVAIAAQRIARSRRVRPKNRGGATPFELAREQLLHRGASLPRIVEYAADRASDRHLDAPAGGETGHCARSQHTFGGMPQSLQHVRKWSAARQFKTDPAVTRKITGTGQYQVACSREAH